MSAEPERLMSGFRLVLGAFSLMPSVWAGLIETNREQPPEVIAKWNRSGSAVCPDGYDYIARIRRCVARTVTASAIPSQRNRHGSAVRAEGFNYRSRYGVCLPR